MSIYRNLAATALVGGGLLALGAFVSVNAMVWTTLIIGGGCSILAILATITDR